MNPKDIVGAKKAPLTLVPSALVIAAAEAMGNGAAKYGPFNWREQPVQVMTYVEAVLRHLYAFIDGQELAEDTGIPHLSHAVAGLGILIDARAIAGGLGVIDNRPKAGPAADLLRKQDKSVKPAVVEERGVGDGPIYVFTSTPVRNDARIENRGVWPPDTRVGGLLTCCGQSDHPIDCPQWR